MDIELAAVLVPYVSAVIGAYGVGSVERVQDATLDSATDSTVQVGRRLLRRILGPEGSSPAVRAAVRELAADPDDDDRVTSLRLRLREQLTADPVLARAVAAILSEAGVAVPTPGDGSVAVRTVSDVQSGEWPIVRPR
jgi:hypothetical protein